MLFLHETHKVVGAREQEFEAAYRDGWMPTLANGDDARLLWYANHAHGSGVSYNVVTITGITDGAAWESLARRALTGDLCPWMRQLDNLRHEVTGKLLLPVYWSPLQTVDLASVPTTGATHPVSMFMEDTGWPHAPLDDYIRSWDEIYYRPLSRAPAGMRILDIQACFQVAHGSYRRREAMLWQKIDNSNNYAALVHLLTKEVPAAHRAPGSYMFEALKFRDQWESRLLRTSDWSPLY
ncbi:hypothetical protein A5787_10575 [Mycobacterium sp. 852002-50816_SCH5313054-b]|uniref:hypothetical protein n=1 Tax=Mycobacterium sp. 852002-50816_SCH5313054-b TaxID=1834092 RepID=UPI0007FCDDEB|nr:hypothetical protein [Mycobacterium sp. 852002-50816_SCH5313054-b]OBF47543.1 hypothetical protein A5787_10575 [Mycobacterium sp. 852002-50816_SCH5313054-b]